ncbi:DNA polymerase III subunit alpha [Bacillus sp. NRRL B-14911]|nr:DNA polymerase III subunit alpha [Bacillus sp. NRRL B-14911]
MDKLQLLCSGSGKFGGIFKADEQGFSAFRIVQLQRLETRVISQSGQKVKEQPSVLLVLCLSSLGKPLPHFLFSFWKRTFYN